MDNFIIQASSWLKSDDCRIGSIQDRTQNVLKKFKDYLRRNKEELYELTGVEVNELVNEVVSCQTVFGAIISSYLKGVHYIAIGTAKKFINELIPFAMEVGARLYKARASKTNYLYGRDEMFHIPYDKRCKVGNHRFSVSGMPCLYLASSSYVCWEELGRVDFQSCNFCGYSNKSEVPVYDLELPPVISSISDIKRICVILACSLVANREDIFKVEYILPQCFLQAMILKHHYAHLDRRLFGVRYISTHALSGCSDCFDIDFEDETWRKRLCNYVFPAATPDDSGYNRLLKDLFVQTDTTSMFQETLLNPDKLIGAINKDVYLDSQFGLMDAFLDEKMGYKPLRKEATILAY